MPCPDPLGDDQVAGLQSCSHLLVELWAGHMRHRDQHEIQRRIPTPHREYRMPDSCARHLDDPHNPVTFFVVPDQGAVVTRSGMAYAPSRTHDPGLPAGTQLTLSRSLLVDRSVDGGSARRGTPWRGRPGDILFGVAVTDGMLRGWRQPRLFAPKFTLSAGSFHALAGSHVSASTTVALLAVITAALDPCRAAIRSVRESAPGTLRFCPGRRRLAKWRSHGNKRVGSAGTRP